MALSSTSRRRPLRLLLASLGATLLALTAVAAPAGAHNDEGEMTVLVAEETAPLTITVEVGLVYTGDGHLAENAQVVVNAVSGDVHLEPVRLEGGGEGTSRYTGRIEVPEPGTWTLDIESTDPAATATATAEVAPEPIETTTTPSTTTTAPGSDGGTDADPADDAADVVESDEVAAEADDDGISPAVIVLIVLGVLVVAGAAVVALRQRSRTEPGEQI